jgi:mannose-6-phosphate isomerase
MDCAPGARIIHGLAPGLTAAALAEAARLSELEPCLRRIAIRPGDFLAVPAGLVHAILGGTLLCEVQQSSNLTYRLWDWDRRPARPLHIGEACEAARCEAGFAPDPLSVRALPPGRWHPLIRNEYFVVWTAAWPAGGRGALDLPNPHGLVVNVVEGAGRLGWSGGASEALTLGQTWFLPAGMTNMSIEVDAPGLRLLASASLELQNAEEA